MRFQELFLDAGAVSPLFLHAPGEVMKAEGVDGRGPESCAPQSLVSFCGPLLMSRPADMARESRSMSSHLATTQSSHASLHGMRSQPRRA